MKMKKSTLAVFLAPALILFCFVYLVPLVIVFATSFCEWRLSQPIEFAGFYNYIKAFSDKNVLVAVVHTLIWVILQMTVHVGLGTLLAFILAERFRGWKIYRTVCMLPNVISTAALAMILINVFKTDSGLVNDMLSFIAGRDIQINWYFNTDTAFFTVTLGWLLYPGLITILVLSAIAAIPTDCIEAARLDGATRFQVNTKVVLPMIRNTLGTCVIISGTSMLKEFELIFLSTNGGPGNATLNLPLYIYKLAFGDNNYGYSNAISVLLILFGVFVVYMINRMFKMDESLT